MAGTITKNLKLKAILDDQQFKKQLQDLKKEMGGVEIGGSASGFDKSAKALSDAAQSLRQVADSLKRGGTAGGTGSNRAVGSTAARSRDVKTITDEVTKNTSNQIRQFFDAERSRYVSLKPGASYDKEMGRTFQRDMDHEKSKTLFKEREQRKEQDRAMKGADKQAREESRKKEMERRKDTAAAKDTMAALLSRTGMGLPMARQASQAIERAAPGMMGQAGGMIRGAGGGIPPWALRAGMGFGGVLGGVSMAAEGMSNFRALQIMRSQREQLGAMGALGGEGLGASVEQAGREDSLSRILGGTRGAVKGGFGGALAGAAAGAGVGFAVGGLGAIPGAIIGGIAGGLGFGTLGAFSGAEEAGTEEGNKRRQQIALAEAGLKNARALRSARVTAMRGGAVNGDQLTNLQQLGGNNGFGAEETIQQFLEARSALGNGAATALPGMQRRMQMTGIGVGEQANAMETFMGAGRNISQGAAFTKTLDVLKKGVAAGLDVSKSGKFLQTTADFIRSQQGLGQIDTDAIATRLAQSASGFAGGGAVTSTSLNQAAQLQDMLSKEATATGGFAGLGNVQNIIDTLGSEATPGLMMALQNVGANATQGDVEDILKMGGFKGDTGEAAKKFQKGKMGNLGRGLGNIGDPLLELALGGSEAGVTTEQMLNRRRVEGTQTTLDTDAAGRMIEAGMPTGPEQESLVQEFKTQNEAFVSGMQSMNQETNVLRQNFADFSKTLEESRRKLEQLVDSTVRNKTGR